MISQENIGNISELDKLKWYGEKELKSLGVYDECCFEKNNGALLKKWGQKSYILGASALNILKKKYNLGYNDSDVIDVITLARILQNPYVFDHIRQNPDVKIEKRVGNSKIDFIPIQNLHAFKEIGPLERKLNESEKNEILSNIPELKISFQDMKYISDHRYKKIDEIEKFLDIPSPIIEAALYKMRIIELPSKQEVMKLARIVEAIQAKGKKWTSQEIEFLKMLYSVKVDAKVSADMKRDVDEIQEIAKSLGLEKINPLKRYDINEILYLTGLKYDEINKAVYSNELDYEVFEGVKGDKDKRLTQDMPDHGTVFIKGSSLIRFIEKGGRKKEVKTRREKFESEMCKKNPAYNSVGIRDKMMGCPLLSYDEETDLLIRMKNGDMLARDDLIEANYKLAMNMALKMASKGRSLNVDDLFQEGCIGLIEFASRYDLDKKTKGGKRHKVSTYATWWVMQGIVRAIIDKGDIVRRPAHIPQICNKISTYSKYYIEKNGEEPSISNISKALKISRKRIRNLKWIAKSSAVSLNKPIGEDEENELSDIIADKDISGRVEYRISEHMLRSDVCKKLKKILTRRDYSIIEKRYGLDGVERTLEEVGDLFDLTRERVRQICEHVMKKAKKNKELKESLKSAGLNF